LAAFGNIEEENISDLKFIKIGKGIKNALAFHGFGQDNSYFAPFESIFGQEYTIYCFNLPFHGDDTTIKSGIPATKDILKDFFQNFFDKNHVAAFTNIGFSIGAKMSIALLELFPERTEKMVLMAPDGFRTNIWYNLGTGSRATRSLFKYFVHHPDFFFKFSESMASLRLIHPGTVRFAKTQMNSLEKREKVFYTWMFLRKLRLSKDRIINLLIKHKVQIFIFLGKEDKIILERHFRFIEDNKKIESNITILPAGHNDLIKETAKHLEESWKSR